MKNRHTLIAAALLLAISTQSFADCAADATVRDVTTSFTKGQNAEKAGDLRGAFEHFVAAQEYTCDPNPVAANAAARAAALSKPLAQAAAAKGDHAAAFDLHERGGHFRDADRALLAWTEAQPDDPDLYVKAMQHFEYRASPAFADNEKVRLTITGKYTLDPALVVRVRAMPMRGVERALAAEAKAFDEQYLQQRLALAQSRPEDLLDAAARQQYVTRAQALQAQRRSDALEDSQDALDLVREWSQATRDQDEGRALSKRLEERANLRVSALTGKYAGAPDLMAESTDYLTHIHREPEARTRRETQIRRQAEQLGDAAMTQQKLLLASEYFAIARADDKARRAQELSNARQQQRMQPAIDEARKNAEAMAANFADPAKVQAMQQQAREMQRQMEESAAARRTPAAQKSRDDLAKELGL